MATRKLNRVVLQTITGQLYPQTGLSVALYTDDIVPQLVAIASENPAGSGNYEVSWTTLLKYGYWYVGVTKKDNWGRLWLGDLNNIDGLGVGQTATAAGTVNTVNDVIVSDDLFVSGNSVFSSSISVYATDAVPSNFIYPAHGPGWSFLSNNNSLRSGIVIGRASTDATLGVAETTNRFFLNSVGGALCINDASGILLGSGSGIAAVTIKNNNIGIGKDPTSDFDVSGSSVFSGSLTTTGNAAFLGNTTVGKSSANAPLDVNGNTIISGSLITSGNVTVNNGNVISVGNNPFNLAGREGICYLGDTNNYIKAIYGGNIIVHAAGMTNGIQFAQNHDWLGVGKSPTTALDVYGSSLLNGSLIVSGTTIISGTLDVTQNIIPSGTIQSTNFNNSSDPLLGYRLSTWDTDGVTPSGLLEINTVKAENMHVKTFTADIQRADNGAVIVCNSVVEMTGSSTLPPGAGSTFSFTVKSFQGMPNTLVFSKNDYIRVPTFARNSGSIDVTNDKWFQINSATPTFDSSGKMQTWQGKTIAGYTGGTINDGQLLLDYGQSNQGTFEIYAAPPLGQGVSPFAQITTWGANPYGGSQKTVVRIGELSGVPTTAFGTLLESIGFYASGNAYLEGGINATRGNVGGFGIDDTYISSSNKALIMSSSGQITGSKVFFTGGKIGGFALDATHISSSNSALILSSSGEITGSQVYFTGGTIGGWGIGATSIYGSVGTGILNIMSVDDAGAGTHYPSIRAYDTNLKVMATFGKIYFGNTWKNDFGFCFTPNYTTGNPWFQMSSGSSGLIAQIAGFTFDANQMYGSNIRTAAPGNTRVELNGTNNCLSFVSSSFGSDVDSMKLSTDSTAGSIVGLHVSSSLGGWMWNGDALMVPNAGNKCSILAPHRVEARRGTGGGGYVNAVLDSNAATYNVPALLINDTKVVGAQISGWTTPTSGYGPAPSRTYFTDTGQSVGYVAAALAQLIIDLKTHGIISN